MTRTRHNPGMTLSVCIITWNEAENLPRCLASVRDLASQIVVVDSLSQDRTCEIAADAGAEVWKQPFLGYVRQKQVALDKARGDWVLCLDADEWLDEDLRAGIRNVINCEVPGRFSGYEVNRRNCYLGRWIQFSGWSPQWRLRMVRGHQARWTGTDPHDRLETSGTVGRLKGRLCHFPYKSVAAHVDRANHYSSILAGHRIRSGQQPSIFGLVLQPPWSFLQVFLLRGGFRDGLRGFVLAWMHAFHVFLQHAKRWEEKVDNRRSAVGSQRNPQPRPQPNTGPRASASEQSNAEIVNEIRF